MGGVDYYDNMAEGYDSIYNAPIPLAENEVVIDIIRELVKGHIIRRILDIGCGTGKIFGSQQFDISTLERYVGIDISPQMLAIFQEKTKGDNRVTLIQQDMNERVDELYPPDSFDLIISTFGAFSYIIDSKETLSVIAKSLSKSNGHLCVMVYSRFSVNNIARRLETGDATFTSAVRPYNFRGIADDALVGPVARFYNADDLRDLAAGVGLKQVKIMGMNAFVGAEGSSVYGKSEEAKAALLREMDELKSSNLGHSLILTATNYE